MGGRLVFAVEFDIDGQTVRIGGIAKGAGMIDPNMAMMLCFITTDAAISRTTLQKALSVFNTIASPALQAASGATLLK